MGVDTNKLGEGNRLMPHGRLSEKLNGLGMRVKAQAEYNCSPQYWGNAFNSTTRNEKENDLKATKHSGANDNEACFQNTWKIIAEIKYFSWYEHWLQDEDLLTVQLCQC